MPKRGVRKKYFNCKIYLKLQQLSSPTGVSKNIKDKKTQTWKGEERHKQGGMGLKQPRNANVCNKLSFVVLFFLNKKKKKKTITTINQTKKNKTKKTPSGLMLFLLKKKGRGETTKGRKRRMQL